MRLLWVVSAIVLLGQVPAGAPAETATALIREGDPVAGAPAGHVVGAIDNTAVNKAGGWAVTLNSTDGVTTLDHAWGNASDGPGALLFSEGLYGQYQQTSWEAFFGISDDGLVCYSAISDDTKGGFNGLDGVWLNAQDLAVARQPYPNEEGMYWSFGSRPGVTSDGIPHWVGGFTDTEGGATQNRGLYLGEEATPLLVGGDMVGGLPDPVSSGGSNISFDYRFSAQAAHWIAEVATLTGSGNDDNHMVIDKNVITIAGLPCSENGPVPPEAGGLPGELWDNFDYAGITESGSYMFTGDTSADVSLDEFVLIDGEIVHREGDTLDGEVLSGAMEAAYMNESGDYAFIWDIQDNSLEALYFGDRLIVREGDTVDWDGDGAADADHVLTDFTGISPMTLGERDQDGQVKIYFVANVLLPDQQELEAAFAVAVDAAPSAVDGDLAGSTGAIGLSVAPNPSVLGRTGIRMRLPATSMVNLLVTDAGGRTVRTLVSGVRGAGVLDVLWDGRDDAGRPVASGVYFVHGFSGERRTVRRVAVIR